MKFIITGILLSSFLFPKPLFSQQDSGYAINSRFIGLDDSTKVFLSVVRETAAGMQETKDSAYVMHGQFHLTGAIPQGPQFCTLTIEHVSSVRLFIDNGEHILLSSDKDIKEVKGHAFIDRWINIDGSPSNSAWQLLHGFSSNHDYAIGLINREIRKIKDSIGFDPNLISHFMALKEELTDGIYYSYFQGNNTDTYRACASWMEDLFFGEGEHSSRFADAYHALSARVKDSYDGRRLKDLIPFCPGQVFTPFTLPDMEGKMVSLKSELPKGKITLVHFWGTHSYEREPYQKDLMQLYKKYHSKGLNVIGVVADTSADEIRSFVRQQQFPWNNVSDLKGWMKGSIIQDVYGEGGHHIPNTTNVLIDGNGKIIAWDPQGVLLQWYIWKYVGE